MAANDDLYKLCPCGSGKKLKFCCHQIVGEMQRINELASKNQFVIAIQALEKLEKGGVRETTSRAWILATKAICLLRADHDAEAVATARGIYALVPKYPLSLAIEAYAACESKDFAAARGLLEQTAEQVTRIESFVSAWTVTFLAQVAGLLSDHEWEQRHWQASRYLALSSLAWNPRQEELFQDLQESFQDKSIPYPLRDDWSLRELTGWGPLQEKFDRAVNLAGRGCAGMAAGLFAELTQQKSDAASLWFNLGLCRAWMGDDAGAADALRRSVPLEKNPDSAVEAELLAQLLPLQSTDRLDRRSYKYTLNSVAKLLSALDQQPRLVRMEVPAEQDPDQPYMAGVYSVLDRERPKYVKGQELSLDDLPVVAGMVAVTAPGSKSGGTASVELQIELDQDIAAVQRQFEEWAGADVSRTDGSENVGSVAREQLPWLWKWFLDPEIPAREHDRLRRVWWQRVVHDVWPTSPLAALGGKTPREAGGNPQLKTALSAAVLALDAFCDQFEYQLDLQNPRSRLNVAEPEPISVTDDQQLHRLSLVQLHRVPLHELNDQQLGWVASRTLAMRHQSFSYELLTEMVARPALLTDENFSELYLGLSRLCQARHSREEALLWVSKGRDYARHKHMPLEALMPFDVRELLLRLDDPNDPQLPRAAQHVWNTYARKIPQLGMSLAPVLVEAGLSGPWHQVDTPHSPAEQLAPAGGSGIWTPDAEAASGQPSKLWVPET